VNIQAEELDLEAQQRADYQLPRRCYFICMSPRSGSTLLCDALRSTGVAGKPIEYFHEAQLPESLKLFRVTNFYDYFWRVLGTCATENGVFGVKLAGGVDFFDKFVHRVKQFPAYRDRAISAAEMMNDLFPDLRYIWLTRRNKVRQAVSNVMAVQSGIWHSHLEPQEGTKKEPEFDFGDIDHSIQTLVIQDAAWQEYFTQANVTPMTLVYEDFCSDLSGTARRVLEFLDIPIPSTWRLGDVKTGERLANSTSDNWVQSYNRLKKIELYGTKDVELVASPSPLEKRLIELEERIRYYESYIRDIQQGRVMRILRKVDRLLGRE
jgi:LPS sulfotransferase NodH